MQIRYGVIKISFKSIAFACSNIKRFMLDISSVYSVYVTWYTVQPAMIVCIVAWKLSLRSLCNDNSHCWKRRRKKHNCLLAAASPLSFFTQFCSFSIVLLQFLFIIFNGCFVRRLTFYCYLMKWVWLVFCSLNGCAVCLRVLCSHQVRSIAALNTTTIITNSGSASAANHVTFYNDCTRCTHACAFAPHLNKRFDSVRPVLTFLLCHLVK